MRRQITSTWMAASRVLLGKLLLILAAMAAVQMGLFAVLLAQVQNQQGSVAVPFENLLLEAGIGKVFYAALAATAVACTLQGCRFSGKNLYTLQRLPLGEVRTTILWAMVHLACYVILWAGQLAVVFGLWQLFGRELGSGNPGLELFVAFYNSNFLHTLVPLAEVSRWIAMVFYGLTLAWSSACFGFFQRRGRIRAELPLLLGNPLFLSSSLSSTGSDLSCIAFYIVLWCTQCMGIWGVTHDEEPT